MAYVLLGNPRERGLNVKNNPEIPNGIKKMSVEKSWAKQILATWLNPPCKS